MAKQETSQPNLARFKALLVDTDKVYKRGKSASADEVKALQEKWSAALENGDDRGVLMGYLMLPVTSRRYDSRLISLAIGESFYQELGADWAEVTEVSGYSPSAYNRIEGQKSLDALESTRAVPERGGLVAIAAHVEGSAGLGRLLRSWVHAERKKATRDRVVDAIEDATGTESKTDPRAELEKEITRLEGLKSDAVKAEEFKTASELKVEIEGLREQLTHQVVEADTPTATEPEGVTEAPDGGENEVEGLENAIEACEASTAGKALRRIYQRWDRDEISDEEFVQKVGAITAS